MLITSNVIKRVLPNGLTILIQRVPNAEVVSVVTHVKAGYFDEPDEWTGIAHVLEHMYFKGTSTMGPGELAAETQSLGGYLNAGTIYDKTVYYTVLPAVQGGLDAALRLQSDALLNLAIDPGELAKEIEVIVQEAKRKLDSQPAVTRETLHQLLFREHRMRRWRIGTEAGLRALSASDVRSYYETRYRPDRVIVALVGGLDEDRALALVERYYGGFTRKAVTIEGSPAEPPGVSSEVRVLRGDVAQPRVALGWKTVDALHKDAPALDVVADVLGSGRGSLLRTIVRNPGLAASVGADHYTPTEVGVFTVSLVSEPGTMDDAVGRTLGLMRTLADRGPDERQLARVRALNSTHWARRLEAMDGRATMLAQFEALGGYDLAEDWVNRVLDVSPAGVRTAAGHLMPDSVSAVAYLPDGAHPRFTSEPWPPVARIVDIPSGSKPPAAQLQQGRSRPEPPAREVAGVTVVEMRGVDLLLLPRPGVGIVSLSFGVPGLTDLETTGSAGVSWLLARTALRGAGARDAEELAAAAELLGGAIHPSVGREFTGYGMMVRPDGAKQAAELLSIVATDPALKDDDVLLERKLQAEDAARVRDDMFSYPLQRVLAEAFAGHGYALPLLGDPEGVGSIEPQAVREWSARLQAQRAVVVAVGDLPLDELVAAAMAFESWDGMVGPPAPTPAPWQPGRGHESRVKAQSALAMAFPAPSYRSPERPAVRVAATLLSGLTGRLFKALRERLGLAYTVHAAPWMARHAGAFLTYIATSPDREEEARTGMLAELSRVIAEPPSDAELERTRSYSAGLEVIRRQHTGALAGDLLDAWLRGMIESWEREAELLRSVTAEEVAQVSATMLSDPERRAEYVVRGTAEPK